MALDNDRPKVTVGIPAWNGERFIGAAVGSVLAQTYSDLELVVIDDASTDGTAAAIRRFHDPRLRVLANPANIGHEANWNRILREARGTYVKLLPQDDVLHPDCLKRQVQVLEDPENRPVVLVCCARNIIDADGRVLTRRSFKKRKGRLPGLRAVRECVRSGTNLIGEPGAVLMRADSLAQAGPFNAKDFYVVDLDLWARLLLQGDLFVLPEPLCSFRVASGSASIRVASTQSRDFVAFVDRLRNDGRYGLTRLDRLRAILNARRNMILRKLLYRFVR